MLIDHDTVPAQGAEPAARARQAADGARWSRPASGTASASTAPAGPSPPASAIGWWSRTTPSPATIIVLTDSHTPTAGVLNAFAFGVGSTAMAFALRTGLIPVTVPKTVRVVV